MIGTGERSGSGWWTLTPLTIAAIYAFLGALWVLFSDRILITSGADTPFLLFLHGVLMLVFVVLSAFILFYLINRYSKGIRRSEAQYRGTIDTLRDGILVLDEGMHCTLWNETLAGWCMRGGAPVPSEGMALSDLIPVLPGILRACADHGPGTGTPVRKETMLTIGSFGIAAEISPIPAAGNDGSARTVVVIRDISDQRRLEEIKEEMFRSMEKTALDFATLSDQIRNPLQVIVALSSMDGEDDTILKQAREIDRIIDRLDRGWVEAGKINLFLKEHYGEGDEPVTE